MESFYANAGRASDDAQRVERRNAKRPNFVCASGFSFLALFLLVAVVGVLFAEQKCPDESPADKSLSHFLSYGTSEAPLLIFNESSSARCKKIRN
jgi:hypothetical protein